MSNKRRKNFDEPLQSNQNSYAFLDKENIVSFKRKSIPKKKMMEEQTARVAGNLGNKLILIKKMNDTFRYSSMIIITFNHKLNQNVVNHLSEYQHIDLWDHFTTD